MKKRNKFLTVFSAILLIIVFSITVDFTKKDIKDNNSLGFRAVLAQDGSSITFDWDDPDTEDNVSFYRLHHGVIAGNYGEVMETSKSTTRLILDISNFETYDHYFAISAVDIYGNESDLSQEIHINTDPELESSCGNGIKEEDEICDGGYMACEISNSSYKGEKKCNDCNWGSCEAVEFCGDGIINGDEVCEFKEEGKTDPEKKGCVTDGGVISERICTENCQWGSCEGI
ncbi:hypothetical protein EOL94_03030 [bacterium]|nr:hypothetical protein [bacterium]